MRFAPLVAILALLHESSTTTPAATPRPTKKTSAPSTPAPKPAGTPAAASPSPSPAPKRVFAPNASLEPGDLAEFHGQPARVQSLITAGLALTKQNLTYTYGSADPANGGMDCSGTIYYLLRIAGFEDVPRDSPGQYAWVRKAGEFRAVLSRKADSFEFDELLPGDLMFWSGTYATERDIPVTHVMLYLGTEKKTKKPVMFGASDGRSYAGKARWGVSVFDFVMPRKDGRSTFLGYGRIPGLRDGSAVATTVGGAESAPASSLAPELPPNPSASPTPKPTVKKPASKTGTSSPRRASAPKKGFQKPGIKNRR